MDDQAILDRYSRLRAISSEICGGLFRQVPRVLMEEWAGKIGILRRGVIMLESEEAGALLANLCLFCAPSKGVSRIVRHCDEQLPDAEGDRKDVLLGLRETRYTLIQTKAVRPGVGVEVYDVLHKTDRFLVDRGLSNSAQAGLVLAGHMWFPPGLCMTAGSLVPIGRHLLDEIGNRLTHKWRSRPGEGLQPREQTELATFVVRTCLRDGTMKHIRYS